MKKYLLMFAAALVGMTACDDVPGEVVDDIIPGGDDPIEEVANLEANAEESYAVVAAGATYEFDVTANTAWAVTADADWVTFEPAEGEADAAVVMTVAENATYDVREAKVTIAALDEEAEVEAIEFTVTQDEKKAMIMQSDSKFEVAAEGATIEINFQTNVEYEVVLGAEWLSLPTATRALEDKVVAVVVAANETFDAREATITIKGEGGMEDVVTVSQAAKQVEEEKVIDVTAADEVVPAEGGQVMVAVAHNVEYTVSTTVDWITKATTRAVVTDSLTFNVAANEAATARLGYIVVNSELGSDTVSVAQLGNTNAIVEFTNKRLLRIFQQSCDLNEDGDISVSELASVTEFSLESQGSTYVWTNEPQVTDLNGIEYLVNLEKLNLSNTNAKLNPIINSVDFSKYPKLKELRLNNSALNAIDLSNNTELEYLDLGMTKITSLDLSNNTKITNLQVSGSQLTSLDVSALKDLKVLNCAYNKISTIDLSNNTALEAVYVNGNGMTELNVSALAGLKRLNCEHNALTSLDVTANSQLVLLNCGRNANMTSLKVNGLANLTNLSFPYNTALTSVDLSGLSKLHYLYATHSGLTSLATTGCPELWMANVDNCALTSVDMSANAALRSLLIDNIGQGQGNNGAIFKDGNNALTTIDLAGNGAIRCLYATQMPSLATVNLASSFNLAKPLPETFFTDAAVEYTGGYFDDTHHSYFPAGTEFVDLSANGTSNCYIVNTPGTAYKFKATVKGNGAPAMTNETTALAPASASVLWMVANITDTKPSEDGGGWPNNLGNTGADTKLVVVESVELSEDGKYVCFATPEDMINGNAIVVAKDGKGNVVWSWHLWILNGYDAAASDHYVTASNVNTYMMDRNIGATASPDRSATPTQDEWTQARGFYYQWGRKDPFMGSCKLISGYAPKIVYFAADGTATVGYAQYGGSKFLSSIAVNEIPDWSDVTSSVAYSVANPNVFISGNGDGSYSWVAANKDVDEPGTTGEWGKLWGNQAAERLGGVKTMYDPCPVGYRVPSTGHFRFITSHGDNAGAAYNKLAEWKYNCVEQLFNEAGEALNEFNNVAPFGLNFYVKGSKTAAEVAEGAQNYGNAPEDPTTAYFPAQGLINWAYSDKTYYHASNQKGSVDVLVQTNCTREPDFYGYSTLFMKAQRNGEFYNDTNSYSYGEQQAKALPVRCIRETAPEAAE